jgi:UDP-N-acetylmuramate--alanine ligase
MDAANVHLVGMGGSGMSSLASLLLDMGKHVSGSDLSPSGTLARLEARGARVCEGHAQEHLGMADLVVISSAVGADNPEVQAAMRAGVRVVKHAEALSELMRGRTGIAIAGTHGKSTTTALTAYLLYRAGLDPTLAGGAESLDFGASSRLGSSDRVVVEADEYDRRFLHLRPRLAVVTSVEPDHLDYFADLREIEETFQQFVRLLPPDGLAVLCQDDVAVRALDLDCPKVTYGFDPSADFQIERYVVRPRQPARFSLRTPEGMCRDFELGLIGRHNAANAAAALAVARACGAPWDSLQAALPAFRGTRRRFERIGEARGIVVVDDYAHHPTAVQVTLEGAKAWWDGPVWVVFQPHTTHRTAAMLDAFAGALDVADHVVLVPIFQPPGREYAHRPVTSADIASRMQQRAMLADTIEGAAKAVAQRATPGSLVISMGAGDITSLGRRLLHAIQARVA